MIKVVVNRVGYIPQIRMGGPILFPIDVSVRTAYAMVVAGLDVQQVGYNGKYVKLTLDNFYDEDKFDEPSIKKAPEPPKTSDFGTAPEVIQIKQPKKEEPKPEPVKVEIPVETKSPEIVPEKTEQPVEKTTVPETKPVKISESNSGNQNKKKK